MVKRVVDEKLAEQLDVNNLVQQVQAMDAEMVKKAVDERVQQLQNMTQPRQVVANTAEPRVRQMNYESEDGVQILVEQGLDRQTRQNNLVVYNMPELEEKEKLKDMDLEGKDDEQIVRHLMEKQLKIAGFEYDDVLRMPPRAEARKHKDTGKPRPILIKLKNADSTKAKVYRAASTLRQIPHWRDIYISPDKTDDEREKEYQLRQEIKTRKAAGETDLVVRNFKIVKLKPKPAVPAAPAAPAAEIPAQPSHPGGEGDGSGGGSE